MEQTVLDNLVLDNREDGVFRVHRSVFTDPQLMALEQRRVFEQCWLYAGHASEIPQPGDFRSRRVAGRPVILVRGSDGVIRVLLNTCTHRGAQVCRESCGNAKTFQCFYHAWTFNNQGELIGVPGEDAYSAAFDRQELGLASPPRVEIYRDFIFISFNPLIESLVDYLAGARPYLDLVCDQSEAGMEIVTGTQAYSMRANWKLLVENSMDGYHARTTHQRYFEFLIETGIDPSHMRGRRGGMGKALGNGHAVIQSEPIWGRPIARWTPMFGEAKKAELEAVEQKIIERFGAEWAYQMTQTSRNLLIFPNLIINDIMAITVRTFFPVAPDYIEVASRIAGASNGFASNGVAPGVRIGSYKVLAAGFGGLSTWILSGLIDACSSRDIDVVNMSIEGYMSPDEPFDVEDYLLFTDAVAYCRARGVAVFAAAGNQHVRVDRVNLRLGGRNLQGVGRVSLGAEGIATASPGSESLDDYDLRGWLSVPGGVPGVTMVSATANAIGAAPANVPLRWRDHVGARDQLAYYSNYGSRVDLAAPGGARRFQIPGYDGGDGDILYGGWGSFGALSEKGLICNDPFTSSLFNSACFTTNGQAFGWLQGTSMSSPNAVGVAALVLSARRDLRGRPEALERRLEASARQNLTNFMGPNDAGSTAPALNGTPCDTGYCHVSQSQPIALADAYGAGLVDAGAAVGR